jgi:GntR family transcriptional regulator
VIAPLVRDPLYHQLNQSLRGLLRDGEFKPGDQFLTERQVGERFGVSRITANKALSNLVAEGVLEFKKGVGTFVRGGILDYDLGTLVSFTSKARAAGKKPSTRVLEFRTVAASAVVPEAMVALRIGPDEPLVQMVRLRLAGGVPVILEHRVVVLALCPRLGRADAEGSLYAALTERHGLAIGGADETIRAIALRGSEARQLRVGPGAAALQVIALGYLGRGVPLWWERTLYRGDAYEFHNRLGPLETARPAAGALLDPEGSPVKRAR